MITLDTHVRQGIYESPVGDQPVYGTNVDILQAMEAPSPKAERDDDVESGDEASCPEAPHRSDDESEEEEISLSGLALELVAADKRTLALYAAHLEEKVCGLQKVRFSLQQTNCPACQSGCH